MKPALELSDVTVIRDGRTVLDIEELSVLSGEVLTIIGPNGAGKSTLLLAMAGLIQPDHGEIRFQGNALRYRSNLYFRRRIGLVLQSPLLLKASVLDNVTMGARFRGIDKNEYREKAKMWLGRFGISHLRDRPANMLSGGEAQRVSLARAFVVDPEIILLDEPFSALDTPTRMHLLEDLQALIADTGVTTIFVTHDLDEALHLGHRVAVLLDGQLKQIGSPDQVFSTPVDSDVAAFVGIETTVKGRVVGANEGVLIVNVGEHLLEAVGDLSIGKTVLFCVRPDDVTLWSDDRLPMSSARNRLYGPIVKMAPRGPQVQIVVDCGFPMRVLITRSSAREMALEPGIFVALTFKASAVHLIPHAYSQEFTSSDRSANG
jgi:tungstate transport system ATP-binding protein